MPKKWILVNIHLKSYNKTNDVLREFVAPYVTELKEHHAFDSWHFFREPAIRLRFFGEEKDIEDIKKGLDSKLSELEQSQSDLYDKHVFGAYEEEGKVYEGEAEYYGENAWPLVYKLWEAGSELTLKLYYTTPEKPIKLHADRHVHLILNQLGFIKCKEIMFYCDGAHLNLHKYPGCIADCYQKIQELAKHLEGR